MTPAQAHEEHETGTRRRDEFDDFSSSEEEFDLDDAEDIVHFDAPDSLGKLQSDSDYDAARDEDSNGNGPNKKRRRGPNEGQMDSAESAEDFFPENFDMLDADEVEDPELLKAIGDHRAPTAAGSSSSSAASSGGVALEGGPRAATPGRRAREPPGNKSRKPAANKVKKKVFRLAQHERLRLLRIQESILLFLVGRARRVSDLANNETVRAFALSVFGKRGKEGPLSAGVSAEPVPAVGLAGAAQSSSEGKDTDGNALIELSDSQEDEPGTSKPTPAMKTGTKTAAKGKAKKAAMKLGGAADAKSISTCATASTASKSSGRGAASKTSGLKAPAPKNLRVMRTAACLDAAMELADANSDFEHCLADLSPLSVYDVLQMRTPVAHLVLMLAYQRYFAKKAPVLWVASTVPSFKALQVRIHHDGLFSEEAVERARQDELLQKTVREARLLGTMNARRRAPGSSAADLGSGTSFLGARTATANTTKSDGYSNSFTPDRFLFTIGDESGPWGFSLSFFDRGGPAPSVSTHCATPGAPAIASALPSPTAPHTKTYVSAPNLRETDFGVRVHLDPSAAPFKKFTYVVGYDRKSTFKDSVKFSNLPLTLKRWWLELRRTKLKMKDALPRSKEEFKTSTVFCLASEFKNSKSNAIHPEAKVQGMFKGSDRIYSRADVYPLRTADDWRRRGRRVKLNERGVEKKTPLVGGSEILFAVWQTEDRPVESLHANMVELRKEIRYNNAADKVLQSEALRTARNKYGHWDLGTVENRFGRYVAEELFGAAGSSSTTSLTTSGGLPAVVSRSKVLELAAERLVFLGAEQEESVWTPGGAKEPESATPAVAPTAVGSAPVAVPHQLGALPQHQFGTSQFGGSQFGAAGANKPSFFGSVSVAFANGKAVVCQRFLDTGREIPVSFPAASSRSSSSSSSSLKPVFANEVPKNCAWVAAPLAKDVCKKKGFEYIEAASGWSKHPETGRAQREFSGVLLLARHAVLVHTEAKELEKSRNARRTKKKDDEIKFAWTELCKKILVEKYLSRKRKR